MKPGILVDVLYKMLIKLQIYIYYHIPGSGCLGSNFAKNSQLNLVILFVAKNGRNDPTAFSASGCNKSDFVEAGNNGN